jgi:hypothetical protein
MEPLTVAERVERGRAARRCAPRSEHGAWAPGTERRDPIAVLEQQAATRVVDLVPIRYPDWPAVTGRAVRALFAEQAIKASAHSGAGSSCSSGFARQAQSNQANAARVTYMAISATPSKMVASPSPVICHRAIAVRMIAPTYTGASWNVR